MTTLNIDQLNERLPLVQAIARDICEDWQQTLDLRALLESGDTECEEQLQRHLARLERFTTEMRDLGGRVVEFRRGYFGFDGELEGRPVTFSWRLGEDEVEHYHARHHDIDKRERLQPA